MKISVKVKPNAKDEKVKKDSLDDARDDSVESKKSIENTEPESEVLEFEFNEDGEEDLKNLRGYLAIGHNRYSTTGDTLLRNVQPLFGDFSFGGLAVAHNGNLTNAMTLRKQLIDIGCLFAFNGTRAIFDPIQWSHCPSPSQ